jgi:hypothetical protein
MKTRNLVLPVLFVPLGFVVLGAIGCDPGAYRYANEPVRTAGTAHRAAHCRDLPAEVPCRPSDTGR